MRDELQLMPADIAYREAVDRGEIDPDAVPSWQDGYAIGEQILRERTPPAPLLAVVIMEAGDPA